MTARPARARRSRSTRCSRWRRSSSCRSPSPGLFFGQEAARGEIFEQVQGLLGADAARAIQAMVQNASRPGAGIIATLIGVRDAVHRRDHRARRAERRPRPDLGRAARENAGLLVLPAQADAVGGADPVARLPAARVAGAERGRERDGAHLGATDAHQHGAPGRQLRVLVRARDAAVRDDLQDPAGGAHCLAGRGDRRRCHGAPVHRRQDGHRHLPR